MKKLILNKQIIATLANPSLIVGGEGSDTCPTRTGATCPGEKTCGSYAGNTAYYPFCDM